MPSSGPFRLLTAALLTALATVPLTAPTAGAAERTISGGRLDWGIKASFQRYVTGPVARGSWALSGGAATVGTDRFRFHSARGSYDPDSGDLRAGYTGAVRFTGHRGTDGTFELDLTISRPTVRVTGGRGTLHADMTSRARGTGEVTSAAQVPLAALDLSGVTMRGGGSTIALTTVPATLTEQGAKAFAGYYEAGAALDPVTLSADVLDAASSAGGAGSGGPSAGSATTAPERRTGDREPGEEPGADGRFTDAAVDWGVRRTFREYVTGPIARGRWALTDGAEDGGALFRFPRGTGTYDPESGRLDATFAGGVRFTGNELDLGLSAVRVAVRDGRGTLSADVTGGAGGAGGAGEDPVRRNVPLVTFDAAAPRAQDGLLTFTEAPATLTEEGAKAFGGMYRAGTAMDPVSLAVALDTGARLPPLPDLGSDPAAGASPGPGATAGAKPAAKAATAASAGSASPSGFPTVPVALGGAVLVAAAAGLFVRRARRRTTEPAAETVPAGPAPDGPHHD
ncbi:HtaA domain-containing protein [Streptomyces sp. URMC 123]|uniref:HtaA domain-containing protein n=1 Tax=Streptomyces sp. URMC 123 TaxID=3423403 RepID=UPI003F1AF4A8